MVHAVLAVAVAVAAVAAVANWWSRLDRERPAASVVEHVSKPVVTVAIAVLGLAVSDGATSGARLAAAVGFALCLVGDVLLLPRVDRFVAGLAAFLAGHLAFAVMFAVLGLESWPRAVVAGGLVALVGATAGRRIVAGAAAASASLRAPVVAYLAVISTMAVLGWATGGTAAAVGVSLFVVSDGVLGWNRFVRPAPWMDLVVMATYHGALVGLALSLA